MKRPLYLALVLLGAAFSFPYYANASDTFTWTWDGSHFASTSPTTGSFCLTDKPYTPAWGAYGIGYTSPTHSYDFSSWSVNIGAIETQAPINGNNTGDFYIQDCTGASPGQYASFHIQGGNVTHIDSSGDTSTHVIQINQPVLYSTTTSPFTVSFDYIIGNDAATGYSLTFIKQTTRESVTLYGALSSTATGTPLQQSTTTSLTGNGTWTLLADLNTYSTTTPGAPITAANRPAQTAFGINTNDNVSTIVVTTASFYGYASTSCAISFSGSFSLSDCVGYLFLPQADSFGAYTALETQAASKFPFSYVASIATVWKSLVASTTANSPTLAYNFHDAGIGSTTALGNFLPNVTAFSASTTKQYFPAGTFDVLKGLASIALILGLFVDIFFTTRNMIRT